MSSAASPGSSWSIGLSPDPAASRQWPLPAVAAPGDQTPSPRCRCVAPGSRFGLTRHHWCHPSALHRCSSGKPWAKPRWQDLFARSTGSFDSQAGLGLGVEQLAAAQVAALRLTRRLCPPYRPCLNRTVGHLAGRIEEFSLLKFHWLLAIERTYFAVGIELVVCAVGLHHKTHRFASGR